MTLFETIKYFLWNKKTINASLMSQFSKNTNRLICSIVVSKRVISWFASTATQWHAQCAISSNLTWLKRTTAATGVCGLRRKLAAVLSLWSVVTYCCACWPRFPTKGQIISKGLFCFFNSSKKRTKNFCPSRLGQKLEFSSSFFGRIENTKMSFRN